MFYTYFEITSLFFKLLSFEILNRYCNCHSFLTIKDRLFANEYIKCYDNFIKWHK